MSLRNTSVAYGSVSKFFHWVIAFLVIFMLAYGYSLEFIPEEYEASAYNLHKLIGLTVLTLMVLRTIWALSNPKPALPIEMNRILKFGAHFTHILLYVFVIAMPLAGLIGASAAGKYPHIGDRYFYLPVPHNKELAKAAFEWHETIAIILIVLISIHVLGAFYHHFIRKDTILERMLPHRRTHY